MKKRKQFWIGMAALLLGIGILFASMWQKVTIVVNGTPRTRAIFGLTSRMALFSIGIQPAKEDLVYPPEGTLLAGMKTIHYDKAVPVTIQTTTNSHIERKTFLSPLRTPRKLLEQAGIPFAPRDQIFWNSLIVPPDAAMPFTESYFLQHRAALQVTLVENGLSRVFSSARFTLGEALWEEGIALSAADSLSTPPDTPLDKPLTVVLRRAVPLTIHVGEHKITGYSAAGTVGQALAGLGLPLQGFDYSKPGPEQPIPANGLIRLVRVREELMLEQTLLPFKSEYVQDSTLGLEERKVVSEGKPGIKVARLRVRYEDGSEISRQKEAEWTASQPVDQKIAYGAKYNIQTLSTPDGTIEYYRAVTVYATSYSPCRLGVPECSNATASGMPVKKGVIAVSSKWYRYFAGQRVYVPGYGIAVIGDTGGGIPGKYWIDLAYTDDDYVSWHQNVTLYFLTPVPANIPWILP